MLNEKNHISPPSDPPESESIEAVVAEVLEAEVEKAILRHGAPVPREGEGGPLAWISLLILTVISAYLWFSPLGILDSPIPESPASLMRAGIRMELGLQAMKIDDFHRREGRLPNSLAEAGGPFSRVSYERLDGERYLLSLSGPQGVVIHLSTNPLTGLLGDAADVIRRGGR